MNMLLNTIKFSSDKCNVYPTASHWFIFPQPSTARIKRSCDERPLPTALDSSTMESVPENPERVRRTGERCEGTWIAGCLNPSPKSLLWNILRVSPVPSIFCEKPRQAESVKLNESNTLGGIGTKKGGGGRGSDSGTAGRCRSSNELTSGQVKPRLEVDLSKANPTSGGVTASTEMLAAKRHAGVHTPVIVGKMIIANQQMAYAA